MSKIYIVMGKSMETNKVQSGGCHKPQRKLSKSLKSPEEGNVYCTGNFVSKVNWCCLMMTDYSYMLCVNSLVRTLLAVPGSIDFRCM